MTESDDELMRRQFLRGVVRAGALAGLAVLAAVLVRGRGGESSSPAACIADGRCGACGIADRCALPEARAARKASSGG